MWCPQHPKEALGETEKVLFGSLPRCLAGPHAGKRCQSREASAGSLPRGGRTPRQQRRHLGWRDERQRDRGRHGSRWEGLPSPKGMHPLHELLRKAVWGAGRSPGLRSGSLQKCRSLVARSSGKSAAESNFRVGVERRGHSEEAGGPHASPKPAVPAQPPEVPPRARTLMEGSAPVTSYGVGWA